MDNPVSHGRIKKCHWGEGGRAKEEEKKRRWRSFLPKVDPELLGESAKR